MQKYIYLDNSSTTKPCETAISEINKSLSTNWGNPSSLHILGINAEETIINAKENIASFINCRADEIFFTSGGTESNNLAIIGAADALKRTGRRIVTTSIEHPSVLNTCKHLEQIGFDVVYISPESDGNIDADKFISAVNSETILVSIMLVNNETGCILPVSYISDKLKENGYKGLIHTDCVQAFGKLPINVETLGADLISISGHKIHGPKGIGVLYKSKKVNLKPITFGGGQEKGLRSGTEAVPLIAGIYGAIKELNPEQYINQIYELHEYTVNKLKTECGAVINSPTENYLPYIINASFIGLRSETLLHFLEERNIFVSSGSACAKGKGSYVLNEMGLDRKLIDSALRISFSKHNTKDEIDTLCKALCDAMNTLRRKL